MRSASRLLCDLVRMPSPSGSEERAARLLESWAKDAGLDVSRDDASVTIVVGDSSARPTLLLASHLDTVPPGDGWTVDPFAGHVEDGVLYGRGAVDAKSSVAAMASAAHGVSLAGGPRRGRLVVLATYSEETRDTTMPLALERLGERPEAALIGEPTGLRPCVAQRGLLVARLTWRGEQVHAGWSADNPDRPLSSVTRAAGDLLKIPTLDFGETHALLGNVVATVTELSAGVARNVTPPRCEAIVDVRTTPALGHDEVARRLADAIEGEVEVLSRRLLPVETPAGSRLLAVSHAARPHVEPIVSPTSSDWVFLRDVDGMKLGPGDSRLSHTAEERIALSEVDEAADVYGEIAMRYLT